MTTYPGRPRPLADAATGYLRWLGLAGSIVIALTGWGVLSAVQGDALQGLLGAIPGAVNAIATVLTAFGIVRKAEPEVTPVASPRARDGSRLVTLDTVHAALQTAVRGDETRDRRRASDDWWDSLFTSAALSVDTTDPATFAIARDLADELADETPEVRTVADSPADDEAPDVRAVSWDAGDETPETLTVVDGMGQRIAEAVENVDRAIAADLAEAGLSEAPRTSETPAPAPAPVDTRPGTGSHDSGHHSASNDSASASGGGGE